MTKYLNNRQLGAAKTQLTRAKKKGARAVIDEVDATFDRWSDGGYAWPDSWADWQRARDDAEFALSLGIDPRW